MEFENILFRAKQGEKMAVEQILNMYRPMLVRNALVNGKFDEDLFQELTVEILKCIKYFKKYE